MISRVVREAVRQRVQETGHFIVDNYETYNQARYTERYKIKEVEKKDTHVPCGDGDPRVSQSTFRNPPDAATIRLYRILAKDTLKLCSTISCCLSPANCLP